MSPAQFIEIRCSYLGQPLHSFQVMFQLIQQGLALGVAQAAGEESKVFGAVVRQGQIAGIAAGGFSAPTEADGGARIHFSPHDARRFVSAIDVSFLGT